VPEGFKYDKSAPASAVASISCFGQVKPPVVVDACFGDEKRCQGYWIFAGKVRSRNRSLDVFQILENPAKTGMSQLSVEANHGVTAEKGPPRPP
jgi:hypothetical protein